MIEKRLETVREKIDGLAGFVTESPVNIHYLTVSPRDINGACLVTHDSSVLFTDFRFQEATNELPEGWTREIVGQDIIKSAREIIRDVVQGPLGIEMLRLNVADYFLLKDVGLKIEPTMRLIEDIRAVKDSAEIEQIEKGAQAIGETFAFLLNIGIGGRSEKDLVAIIDDHLKKSPSVRRVRL